MLRTLTFDDALAAAEILREASAGHEDVAEALAITSGLDVMDADRLEALRDAFGVEL